LYSLYTPQPPPAIFTLSLHDALPISLSVDDLARRFFNQEYPVSKKWLYGYYKDLEDNAQSGKRLGMYAGIREAEKSFLKPGGFIDRKSTRLNSSHVSISYAVFCLKKK